MRTYPSDKGKKFVLKMEEDWFKKRDYITSTFGTVVVTQVYKRTLWRRFLTFLGIKTKLFNFRLLQPGEVEVQSLED